MGLNPKGRNWGSLVNWDSLGKFYAASIIAWTVVLYAGAAFLVYHRKLAFIKIRNLPLAIAAITFLHVYLVKITLAYTTNGHFPCSAEFWIMSIYLPFGIALFQANLAQLKSISDQQQDLLLPRQPSREKIHRLSLPHRAWLRWTFLSGTQRAYVYIGLGMVIQLVVTAVLYSTTPTLQGDWSSYGDVSHAKGQALCRKSLQWIPSAFWQLAWSWLYGPFLLFQVSKIHDVHYWRLQVVCSVISGLPGTPLWLAAVYSTGFKQVNPWWVPPMWLAPGIVVMQFTTIFLPVYEIIRSRYQMRATLAILQSWEDRHGVDDSQSNLVSSRTSATLAGSFSSREVYSMAALEKALEVNPEPLLKFAATRDFTAENILFLMQVRSWRKAWDAAAREKDLDHERTHLFWAAVQVYISRVDDKTSEFPINIESKIRHDLDAVFGSAVPTADPAVNEDTTFPDATGWSKSASTNMFDLLSRKESDDTLTGSPSPAKQVLEKPNSYFPPHPGVAPLGESRAKLKDGFDEHVFDAAESSIKYLVLTNTWQKFVKEQWSNLPAGFEG